MPSPTNKLQTVVLAGIMFLGVTAYYLAFHQNPVLLVGFLLLIILVIVLFTRPELGLPALLIIRPMVDSVGDYRLAVGNASVNIAGALSIIAIGWSLWILIRKHSRLWDRELFRSMLLVFILSAASQHGHPAYLAFFTGCCHPDRGLCGHHAWLGCDERHCFLRHRLPYHAARKCHLLEFTARQCGLHRVSHWPQCFRHSDGP